MKKVLLLTLCAAMLLGTACIQITLTTPGVAPTQEATVAANTPAPTDAPVQSTPEPKQDAPRLDLSTEAPYEPDLSMLPFQYDVPWDVEEGAMLTADLDFDGHAETYSYFFREDPCYVAILADGETVFETRDVHVLEHFIFVDLDPATPYANILMVIDWGSEDFITTEMHPENGKLVTGVECNGVFLTDDGMLVEYIQTDLLGTKFGKRQVATEQLTPYSEWIDCDIPTKNDWTVDREENIECGFLLHAVRDIEARVDGQKTYIKAGTYLYMVRFNESRTLVEVCTEDGMHAMIDVELLKEDFFYTYLLSGVPQDDLFDNLLYAD